MVDAFIRRKSSSISAIEGTSLTHLRYELDRYLALDELLQDSALKYRLTLRAIRKHGDYSRAASMERKYQKDRLSTPFSTSQNFLEDYLLLYEHNLMDSGPVKGPLSEQLEEENTLLDRHYFLAKLRLACHQAADNLLFSQAGRIPFQSFIIDTVTSDEKWLQYPLIQLYYLAFRAMTSRSGDYHDQLLHLLEKYPNQYQDASFRDIFIALLNVSVRQMNQGVTGMAQYALHLYQLGLSYGFLFVEERLTGQTFANIALTALKLGENDWLRTFLNSYADRLTPLDRATIYPYCLANFHYETGNLEEAGDLLVHLDYSRMNLTMQLQIRITLAKIYFDQGDLDLLESHLSSLQVFLSRHKELGYHRELVLAFALLARRILRLGPNTNKGQHKKLYGEIQDLPVASFREWLLTRLARKLA